jgi:RNA polymerase sigma-70 factor (ECF subfamily)
MERERLDRFEAWLIHQKAKQLIGKAGLRKADLEDIEQDLALDVLERLRSFDPSRSKRHTFVAMVIEHAVAAIIERRTTAKRDPRREACSLNDAVCDDEGRELQRSDTLDEERGRPGPCSEETRDLKADLGVALEGLSPELRSLALDLQGKSVADIARERGVPRTSLYSDIRKLKAAFGQAGLDQYVGEK